MCTAVEHDVNDRASKVQNQIGVIQDKLAVLEASICSFVDSYSGD